MSSFSHTPQVLARLADPNLAKPLLVKTGLAVAGVGMLTALVAAVLLSQNWQSLDIWAGAMHRLGQVLMFLGLCVVLAAQRTAVAYRLATQTRAWLNQQRPGLLVAVGLGMFLATIPAMVVLPRALAGLWMVAWTALVPAALAVVALCGQGKTRVFCLAAIFPALMLLVAVSAALGAVFAPQPGSPVDLGDFLHRLPDRHLPAFLLCWLLMPVAGLAGLLAARIARRPTS